MSSNCVRRPLRVFALALVISAAPGFAASGVFFVKAGCAIDPDGQRVCVKLGCTIDPDGQPVCVKHGGGIDPNGRPVCPKAGCHIDPDGKPVCAR